MAEKATNTNDTIAKKRATLPMILEFFKRLHQASFKSVRCSLSYAFIFF
jgi:hypothetical protein